MSRIGKKAVSVPAGVKVAVNGQTINIEGPKGKLSLNAPEYVKPAWTEGERTISITLAPGYTKENRDANANWGTTRALVRNMVEGVTKGYEKNTQVVGTGWSAAVSTWLSMSACPAFAARRSRICSQIRSFSVPIARRSRRLDGSGSQSGSATGALISRCISARTA